MIFFFCRSDVAFLDFFLGQSPVIYCLWRAEREWLPCPSSPFRVIIVQSLGWARIQLVACLAIGAAHFRTEFTVYKAENGAGMTLVVLVVWGI